MLELVSERICITKIYKIIESIGFRMPCHRQCHDESQFVQFADKLCQSTFEKWKRKKKTKAKNTMWQKRFFGISYLHRRLKFMKQKTTKSNKHMEMECVWTS